MALHLMAQDSDHQTMSDSIVRSTCPTCGDVVLAPEELGLQLDDNGSRFLFACPRCRQRVSHAVPAGIVHILQAAGVPMVESDPDPITEDDVAEFLAEFERPDCFDQLRRLDRGA